MDKIDHRLDELYKNWHAEYGNANTIEECEEIKNFYKPYLEKYESKYRVLYHLLQQPGLISTHDQHTSVENEYEPAYENTLPGITNIATPIAKSTPVTQASCIPVIQTIQERDIVEPMSSERARAAYLESQIQDMSSVPLPLNIPLMKEESHMLLI